MTNAGDDHTCRVCGLANEEPPWGPDGRLPTFDICDCCGVEFGYEDNSPASTRAYRQRWLGLGASWFSPKDRPDLWELDAQLRRVPEGFL